MELQEDKTYEKEAEEQCARTSKRESRILRINGLEDKVGDQETHYIQNDQGYRKTH